ncbi:MAG: hypothetical protein ACT4NV_05090 [Rhodoferax sp.]
MLEVQAEDGSPWSLAIPFTQLARNPGLAARFRQSTVSARETMHPEGPIRSAKAEFQSRTWLQWGQGKTPLSVEAWPYRLIEQSSPDGTPSYQWVTADLGKRLPATPQQIKAVRSGGATWCTWFAVLGQRMSSPHIADGPTPSIHWMIWRKTTGTSCR